MTYKEWRESEVNIVKAQFSLKRAKSAKNFDCLTQLILAETEKQKGFKIEDFI